MSHSRGDAPRRLENVYPQTIEIEHRNMHWDKIGKRISTSFREYTICIC